MVCWSAEMKMTIQQFQWVTWLIMTHLFQEKGMVHSQLMRFKHLLKNVTSNGESCGSLEGQLNLLCDTDFYVDGDMVHIADMKVDRRFSEFFMLQLEKMHQVSVNSACLLDSPCKHQYWLVDNGANRHVCIDCN